MEKYRWQLIVILITGLVVGVILVIQQGSPLSNTPTVTQPLSGGIYTEALIGNFQRLNPFLDRYNQPDQDVDRLIYSGLVKFDNSGDAQPDLAESWGISKDGSLYNFTLRPNIYWHDGQPVTASDVAFTVGLMKSENALIPPDLREFWSEISINVLSENQLQFALPEAFAPLLDYLSFAILPEHILSGLTLDGIIDHPYNLAPVGSGPFKFDELIINDSKIIGVVLTANETYYAGRPFLEKIVFRYYPSENDAWIAYKSGEVDGISSFSFDNLSEALADPDSNLYSAPEPLMSIVYLNLNDPQASFLQKPEFRKALMQSIDRQSIIDNVYNGQAIMLNGPILPGNWAYFTDLVRVEFTPEIARQQLIGLGYTIGDDPVYLVTEEGSPLSLELLCPDTDLHKEVASYIVQGWTHLGVKVDLVIKPYDAVISDLESRAFQAALVDIDMSGSPDPDPYPFWAQSQVQAGQNYAQWDNRTASEFLEQARISLDFGDRVRLYRNFQVIFQEELPSLPLLSPVYNYLVSTKIKGISFGPFYDRNDRFFTINSWYILAEETRVDPNNVTTGE